MATSLKERKRNLTAANRAYAHGKPFLTDAEYDELWLAIRKEDPEYSELYHTGALPPKAGQHPHPIPMLSLDKAMDENFLRVFLTRFTGQPLIVQPKYDGVAVGIYPTLSDPNYRVVLSGNGYFGDDVTHCISCALQDTLIRQQIIANSGMSCEAVILNKDWDSRLGANPRNVVAGMLNPNRREQHSHNNLITFIPHNQISYPLHRTRGGGVDEIWNQCLDYYAQFQKEYPVDGVVIKVADAQTRMTVGHNGEYPLWAIAWKPPISTADTKITSIEWNVSRTGRVVPTVNYEAVELCGTTNTRATANNAEWLANMGLHTGSTIRIGKAGEIIPKIISNLDEDTSNPELPSVCPICDSDLQYDGVHLICPNNDGCMGQTIRSVEYFYGRHGLDINGVGPSTVEELLQDPELYDLFYIKPWALLHPTIYGYIGNVREAIGFHKTEKILDEVERKLPLKNPADLLTAMGARCLGRKSATRLLQCMAGFHVARPRQDAIDAFLEAHPKHKIAMAELEEAGVTMSPLPKPGLAVIAITGTFSYSREEMIQALELAGYEYSKNANKVTNFLLVGALAPGKTATKKMRLAKRYGIPMRNEEFFLSLITANKGDT